MNPPLTAAPIAPPPECKEKLHEVVFAYSRKTIVTDGERSILELAEAAGVELEWGCRGGGCGRCKVQLRSGKVAMDCEKGLTEGDKEEGWVLACRGCPTSDVTLSA